MAFTVFDSFADVYNDFDESDPQEVEERRLLADAIMSYGLNGTVPELPKGVRRIFMALKDAIDNSKDARAKGGKGGRPRKTKVAETPKPDAGEQKTQHVTSDEPVDAESANTGSENPETVVSESENLGFEKEKPRFPENGNPNLTCPELSCTELSCTGEVRAPDAPGAPTLDEAVAYFEANCLGGDPEAFFDFYASQGWMKSSGMPIADWRAQARQWHRMQRERDADARSRGKPTASEVEAATFKPTRTPEEALAEQERRWASEHPGVDPAKVEAPRGTTADRAELVLYRDAQRLLAARAACERRAS